MGLRRRGECQRGGVDNLAQVHPCRHANEGEGVAVAARVCVARAVQRRRLRCVARSTGTRWGSGPRPCWCGCRPRRARAHSRVCGGGGGVARAAAALKLHGLNAPSTRDGARRDNLSPLARALLCCRGACMQEKTRGDPQRHVQGWGQPASGMVSGERVLHAASLVVGSLSRGPCCCC